MGGARAHKRKHKKHGKKPKKGGKKPMKGGKKPKKGGKKPKKGGKKPKKGGKKPKKHGKRPLNVSFILRRLTGVWVFKFSKITFPMVISHGRIFFHKRPVALRPSKSKRFPATVGWT